MANYPNSSMDTIYYDGEDPWIDHKCEVFIEGELISVTYLYDGEKTVYSGSRRAPGVYELIGTDGCKATIHRAGESRILYGDWKFEGTRGLWKIVLSNHQ